MSISPYIYFKAHLHRWDHNFQKMKIENKQCWLNHFHPYCQYRILYKKFRIVIVYCRYLWIVKYIGAYCMNCIVSLNCIYCTIYKHVGLKWVFLLKFVVLFDINKLLDFFNTKLSKYLIVIVSNKITCLWVFSPLLFLIQNLDYTLNTSLSYMQLQICFLCYENVLNENITIFYFCYYCYKSKKIKCKE